MLVTEGLGAGAEECMGTYTGDCRGSDCAGAGTADAYISGGLTAAERGCSEGPLGGPVRQTSA